MASTLLASGLDLLGRVRETKRQRLYSGVELLDKLSGTIGTVVEIASLPGFLRDDVVLERDMKSFIHQLLGTGEHNASGYHYNVTLQILDVLADDVIMMQADRETEILVYELIISVKNYIKNALGLSMEQFCALSEGCLFWSKKEFRAVSPTNEQDRTVFVKHLRRDGATWLENVCPSTYVDDSEFVHLHQKLRNSIVNIDKLTPATLDQLIRDMVRLQQRITELRTPEDELAGKKVPQFFTPFAEHLNSDPESSRIWSELCSAIQKYARQTPEHFGRRATQAEVTRNFGLHANAYRTLSYTALKDKMGNAPWNTGVLNVASWIALGSPVACVPTDTVVLFTQSSQREKDKSDALVSAAAVVGAEERAGTAASTERIVSESDRELVTVPKSAATVTGAWTSRFYRNDLNDSSTS